MSWYDFQKKTLSESVHDYFVTGGKSGGSKRVRNAHAKMRWLAIGQNMVGMWLKI